MKDRFILILIIGSLLSPTLTYAEFNISHKITVYKNPKCGCCKKWISYLKRKNYDVTTINSNNHSAYKKKFGVPARYASCHTAVIDGYVIEGHVTDRDIQRLLLLRPEGVTGITVPGMLVGTPGMEQGDRRQSYNVLSFDRQGNVKIFSRHKN
ncbi:MAG TPA: DUF411 domain-containing protein [Gammaproteobacteria bacterium]|nr:DUF411 domain-containing protein [Gammaproteobacteria bacterium]